MATIEIIGAVVGLLYLWLEYRASIWLWLVGIIMPLFYIHIFFVGKFYADMAINIYYFFACIYGWIRWRQGGSSTVEEPISHMPKHYRSPALVAVVALFVPIMLILRHCTDSPVPVGDALTTALSMVAMWMLSRKYVEQWLLWILVNAISCSLYFYKNLHATAVLFVIYTVVSVMGYRKWKKMTREP